jgi:hypothetical protein
VRYFLYAKTLIAYPLAAYGAVVKVEMRLQVRSVKGGAVFVSPYQLARFLVVYGGKASRCVCKRLADPFLAATVAEKTERKTIPL